MNNITGDIRVNLQEIQGISPYAPNFLIATELQVFVLVLVTVNVPLVRVSLVLITRNWYSCQFECSLMQWTSDVCINMITAVLCISLNNKRLNK